jgi:hypothetical protein
VFDDRGADACFRVRGESCTDRGVQVLVHRQERADEGIWILRQPGQKTGRIIRCAGGQRRPNRGLGMFCEAGAHGSGHRRVGGESTSRAEGDDLFD